MAPSKSLLFPLPDGISNLTVHIGQDRNKRPVKSVPVISEMMRLHSTVWRAHLRPDGPWLKAGAKEVNFPDDDPNAFEIVLTVIHGQLGSVPETMSFTDLKHLFIMIDKYDLSKSMETFTPKWISKLSLEPTDITDHQVVFDFDGWLSVSWCVGLEKPFSMTLKALFKVVKEESDGSLVVWRPGIETYTPLLLDHVPSVVIGKYKTLSHESTLTRNR